ncbi:MAG: hypothetical protein ACREU6_18525 [Steroidobacteraceae bacterium]
MTLSLVDAFRTFGAKPSNRMRGLSAIATDGAMVLNCSQACFGHPCRGVLRYEDRLSRQSAESKDNELLGQHLTLARDGALPIRMIVTPLPNEKSGPSSSRGGFRVRPDLTGKVVKFDGDHFIIDFTRPEQLHEPASVARR